MIMPTTISMIRNILLMPKERAFALSAGGLFRRIGNGAWSLLLEAHC